VEYLWLQEFDFLNCLLVNGSEDTTRVIGKESVSGTGSSQGEGRENRFLHEIKISNLVHVPGLRLTTAQQDTGNQ